MEEKVKFSIICPVYNSEKFIIDCIDSIVNQSYKNWELILVDDGSTDSSGLICDEFSVKFSQIKVYHLKNGGPYNARIFGYKKAVGDYILSIDSDDTFVNGCFKKFSLLLENSNVDVIHFNCYSIDEKRAAVLDPVYYTTDVLKDRKIIFEEYFKSYSLNQGLCRKCFKRSLVDLIDLEPRESKMFEDGLFSLKILNASSNYLFVNECFYNYRHINNESLCKKFALDKNFDFCVLSEKLELIKRNAFPNKTKKALNSKIVMLLIGYLKNCRNLSKRDCIVFLKTNRKADSVKKILKSKVSFFEMKKGFLFYAFFKLKLFICFNFFSRISQ